MYPPCLDTPISKEVRRYPAALTCHNSTCQTAAVRRPKESKMSADVVSRNVQRSPWYFSVTLAWLDDWMMAWMGNRSMVGLSHDWFIYCYPWLIRNVEKPMRQWEEPTPSHHHIHPKWFKLYDIGIYYDILGLHMGLPHSCPILNILAIYRDSLRSWSKKTMNYSSSTKRETLQNHRHGKEIENPRNMNFQICITWDWRVNMGKYGCLTKGCSPLPLAVGCSVFTQLLTI